MIHVVESGETLFAIGRLYGIPAEEIASYNGLTAPDLLVPGQTLVIPGGGADESIGTLASYGYAYPFTGEPVLEAALPHLSGMASFAYGFTTAGDLVKADDAATVGTALEFGAAPIMTLSTLGADGAFSNELGSLLLSSESMQDILLGQTLAEMREKGFRILDLDFEYVYRRDAERYAGFVARARDLLSPEGYKVICDLAPKTSDGQPGLLYEGHDYAALGEAADLVLLMTYEWGYTYGPPMAVAPINNVRRVVEYGLTRIPAEKIMMGVPNYGYDWPLPFVSGNTKARASSRRPMVRESATTMPT